MKKALSILFILFIFAGLAGSFLLPQSTILQQENRKRATFPSFKGQGVQQYFGQIDKFIGDNFPLREQFVGFYRFTINQVGDQVDMEKAFRGRDDWLFLGNNRNAIIEKLTGQLVPNPEKLTLLPRIAELKDMFAAKGVKVAFVLGPQKASVYPEKLPPIIKPSPQRYVVPYLDWLRDNGIDVIDPTAALIKRKSQDIVYWKHDTHWNSIGGSVAFEEVARHFGIEGCPSYDFKKAPNYSGDLTRIGAFDVSPIDLDDHFVPQWSPPSQVSEHIVNVPHLSGDYRTRITNNPQPTYQGAMWIVGDSFRKALMPFLSNCFSSSYNFHIEVINNDEILESYEKVNSKPDYLIIIVTERMI